jgi:D-glycero-D-manno-heptose 1,7-bisphosphate phosphatase
VHGDQIADLLRDRSDTRVLIEPEPRGTGGALRFAERALAERFYFLNGDSLFDINLLDLAACAVGADAALALRMAPDASRYSEVAVDGEQVTAFRERPLQPGPALINGGVAVLSKTVVAAIPQAGAVSIEREIYPKLAAAGRLRGRAYDRPFIDIGVPDDLARAQAFVAAVLTRPAIVFTAGALMKTRHDVASIWDDAAVRAIKSVNDAGLFACLQAEASGPAGLRAAGREEVLAAGGAHFDAVFGTSAPEAAERLLPWLDGTLRCAAVKMVELVQGDAAIDDLQARTRLAIRQLKGAI